MPPANRLRRSAEFASVIRSGGRVRRGHLVLHVLADSHSAQQRSAQLHSAQPRSAEPRAGLVVGRSVGGSVVRHRVSRRLRAQLGQRLQQLPPGSAIVVRALPGIAADTSVQLGADLDAALARLSVQG